MAYLPESRSPGPDGLEIHTTNGEEMKPIVIVGAVLIVLGGVVMALQGVSYVRDRQEVSVGPIEFATEERGFISPVVGGLVLVAGVVLVVIGRRRS